MQIRHTRPEDLPAMQEIFADARAFMRENGNPDQWGDRFPTQEMIDRDLALHRSYVCEDNGKIAATFAFTTDGEPTYRVIRGGAWLDDAPYRGGKGHARRGFVLHELVHGAVRQHPHRHAREQQAHAGSAEQARLYLLRCH